LHKLLCTPTPWPQVRTRAERCEQGDRVTRRPSIAIAIATAMGPCNSYSGTAAADARGSRGWHCNQQFHKSTRTKPTHTANYSLRPPRIIIIIIIVTIISSSSAPSLEMKSRIYPNSTSNLADEEEEEQICNALNILGNHSNLIIVGVVSAESLFANTKIFSWNDRDSLPFASSLVLPRFCTNHPDPTCFEDDRHTYRPGVVMTLVETRSTPKWKEGF
jgi:hypothetical protein